MTGFLLQLPMKLRSLFRNLREKSILLILLGGSFCTSFWLLIELYTPVFCGSELYHLYPESCTQHFRVASKVVLFRHTIIYECIGNPINESSRLSIPTCDDWNCDVSPEPWGPRVFIPFHTEILEPLWIRS